MMMMMMMILGLTLLYLKKLNTKLLLPTMRAEADALSKKYAQ